MEVSTLPILRVLEEYLAEEDGLGERCGTAE
jgi:hypothetical protein